MGSSPIGEEGPRLACLGHGFEGFYSKDFIRAFNILSISTISYLMYTVIGNQRSEVGSYDANSSKLRIKPIKPINQLYDHNHISARPFDHSTNYYLDPLNP